LLVVHQVVVVVDRAAAVLAGGLVVIRVEVAVRVDCLQDFQALLLELNFG
jgi:hypothetical protein